MTPQNLSEQTLALPSGAGEVSSAGETFQVGGYTGGGSFGIPIAAPPGHAGMGPALALSYSTGGGNGIAGQGWQLSLASVSRRLDRGIPTYNDDEDTFLLQGEELVPTGTTGRYRHRIETRFARIDKVEVSGGCYWVVTERNGTRVFYGEDADHRLKDSHGNTAAWYPSRKQDVHGNEVVYTWTRDATTYDVRLTGVEWGQSRTATNAPFKIIVNYESRDDLIKSARTGFLHTREHRISSIEVQIRKKSDASWFTYRTYTPTYTTSSVTGRSLMTAMTVTCSDPDVTGDVDLPSLTFSYTDGGLSERSWNRLDAKGPGTPLSNPDVTFVRQSGSGLPDLLASTDGCHWLWHNRGQGAFYPPVRIPAPVAQRLSEPGAFISDMSGDGWGDLVVAGGAQVYRASPGGGWSSPMRQTSRPNVDLSAPDVRVLDLDGDGIPDALRLGASGATFFRNLGEGRWARGVHVMGSPPHRLDDPRVHLAGIKGDGLPDLVKVSQGRVDVYPGLGRGRFGTPFRMTNAPNFGAEFNPRYVRFADLTGSGQADLLYVQHDKVTVYFNQGGVSFADGVELGRTRLSSEGLIEPIDLYGNGASGLLVTDRQDLTGPWRYLDLFPDGTPDLLESIDNGLGANTTITYGNSAAHCLRDRAALQPWQSHMPFVQRVVDKVEVHDTLTDLRLNTTYEYHHGVYDGREREFRGFGRVEQYDTEVDLDPDHDSGTSSTSTLLQVMSRSWFHCGTDLDLSDEYYAVSGYTALDHVESRPARLTALRALRGLPLRQEVYTTDDLDTPYSISESVYKVHELEDGSYGKPSDAPLPSKSRSIYTERLPSADARVMTTETTYDLDDVSGTDYGLPTEVTETGSGRASTDGTDLGDQMAGTLTRVRTTEYHTAVDSTPTADYDVAYDSGTEEFYYLVGFVKKTQLLDNSSNVLAEEQFFYDGDDYEGLGHPDAASSPAVVKGLLKCRLVWAFDDTLLNAVYPSGAGDSTAFTNRGNYLTDGTEHYIQAERYKYTDEGLVETAKGPNGATVTFSYDSTYDLFPVGAVDALSHPTTLTRGELLFRVESMVDANGNTTTYGYDVTGLPAWIAVKGKYDNLNASDWDGDTDTSPTQEFSYDFTTSPIQVVVKTRQVRGGATFDVYRYIDGMGRTLQERHTAEPDPDTSATRYRVTGWVEYNAKGQPYRAYQPYFDSSTAYAAPATADKPYVETTYDALGRAIRVDYPDGTYESTSFHPWYQSFYDRNDNASAIDSSDARYGKLLNRFRDHLDTPTLTYFDAFGRQIAVSEDVGLISETKKTFRVTTYEITAGEFTGSTYELPLQEGLSPNYFVMIAGGPDTTAGATPDESAVRVSKDPFGTGNLGTSTADDKLELLRGASSPSNDWIGTVTVWECLGDPDSSGFQLVDVVEVSASTGAISTQQITTTSAGTAWTDLDQVALYGGPRGGGSSTAEAAKTHFGDIWGSLAPSSTDTITLKRKNTDVGLAAATFTVYVVQWGSEHTLQRVEITGSSGGNGASSASDYDSATISEVSRAESWCWVSGYAEGTALKNGFYGLSVALGDGETVNESETSVSVGCEVSVNKSCVVTVHSHPDFDVDWQFKSDGDDTAESLLHSVPGPLSAESTDTSGGVHTTTGTRAALQTETSGGNSRANYERALWRNRHDDQAELVVERADDGSVPWTAWVQSIDSGLLEHAVSRPETKPATAMRVTTYQLDGSTFSGTSYDLTLEEDLARNYFVMVLGSDTEAAAHADSSGVRVTQDPFGTGGLDTSSAANVLRLERGDNDNAWVGTIIVVECLADEAGAGFRLLDVVAATCPGGTSTAASQEDTAVTAGQDWDDLGQVVIYGGPRGGGSTIASGNQSRWSSLAAKIVPSGDATITLSRWSQGFDLEAATFTLYVVEWGHEHHIERVNVTGSNGGSGANATGHYNTATIDEVDRATTWLWMSGFCKEDSTGEGFFGQVLALGDGVNSASTETNVAVGAQVSGTDRDIEVVVHSHPAFAVDSVFLPEGNNTPSTRDATVDAATGSEGYDEASSPKTTEGLRFGVWTTADTALNQSNFGRTVYFPRLTGSTTLTGTRAVGNKQTTSWVQSVDAAGVAFRRLHVTRTVFDLRDQPIEVWDARVLDDATWEFSYDYAGQRIKTAHSTAMGTRYALADASGNPIWSRDARGIEVDRTFDTLNRPLTVTDDDGTTEKLRRQWTYVTYSASDTASMAKNLFGRVEEARDADGLRFFEYDWRGLVTKASHKFWDQVDGSTAWNDTSHSMWATGFAWDPAVPSGVRSGLSNFLNLTHLGSGTSTVEISTTYDAAGRATQVDYPESMSLRMTYNAAGLLEDQEVRRTSSSGWQTIVEDCEYNARGQVTYFKHGNGVETSRDYDSSLERLQRVFTRITGGSPARFQDLRYAYDPVGNPVKITDALRHDTYRSNNLIPNSRSFWYDGRYRLVRATGRKRAALDAYGEAEVVQSPDENDYEAYDYRYAYDEVGNFRKNHEFSTKVCRYKAGRIDLFNGTEETNTDPTSGNWTYDENGNTLHTPRHEELRYTFDSQPRFVDMNGGGAVHYFRHADQRVVRMVRKGTSGTDFGLGIYLGPWEYQQSANEGWTKTVLHCEGHGRHAQVEVVHNGTDSNSEDIFFNHGDHLGSGHVLTKDDGTLLSQEEYFPYGKSSDRRNSKSRYRYIGVERDSTTGLSMTGPRTYDSGMGRFLQGDPLLRLDTFGYSSGNPVRFQDSSGYQEGPVEDQVCHADEYGESPVSDIASESFDGDDVSQGGIGNCYLVSSIAATADSNQPGVSVSQIQNNIVSQEGTLVTFRLYKLPLDEKGWHVQENSSGEPDYSAGQWTLVTVDLADVVTGAAAESFDDDYELWVGALELAYAELYGDGSAKSTVEGTPAVALATLTGGYSFEGTVRTKKGEPLDTDTLRVWNMALQSESQVVISVKGPWDSQGHALEVRSVDVGNQEVTLYDTNFPQNGEFTVSMDQLNEGYDGGYPGGSYHVVAFTIGGLSKTEYETLNSWWEQRNAKWWR